MCVCAPACFIWVFVWVWGFNEALLTQHISWGNGRLRGKAARVFHEQAAKRLPQSHPCNVTTKRADITLLCQSYSHNPSFIGLTDACEIISPAPLPAHVHARTFAHDLSKFDWRAQPSVAGCIVDISRGRINWTGPSCLTSQLCFYASVAASARAGGIMCQFECNSSVTPSRGLLSFKFGSYIHLDLTLGCTD